jgi:hypothetical protein
MKRRWLHVLALALLCACHADLDWRELRSDEGRFTAWLPGRFSLESRTLSAFGSTPVRMQQWSAKAKESVFAVGYADFQQLGRSTLVQLSDALVGNISGSAAARREISVSGMQGIETVASGQAGGVPVSLHVRVYARGNRLYQVAVLGRPGDVSQADMETFFGSFRLIEP